MKRLMLVLIAVTSCACGRELIPTLSDAVLTIPGDNVVRASDDPTPRPTPTQQPGATATTTPTPDPCPVEISTPVWTAPITQRLEGTRSYIRCEMPPEATSTCFTGSMAYAWGTEPYSGFHSIQHGTFTEDGGMLIDSTVFPNGPMVIYCSPMAWTGLWAPNPATLSVIVGNYPND